MVVLILRKGTSYACLFVSRSLRIKRYFNLRLSCHIKLWWIWSLIFCPRDLRMVLSIVSGQILCSSFHTGRQHGINFINIGRYCIVVQIWTRKRGCLSILRSVLSIILRIWDTYGVWLMNKVWIERRLNFTNRFCIGCQNFYILLNNLKIETSVLRLSCLYM